MSASCYRLNLVTPVILACGRAGQGVGLRPLANWNCAFESRRGMDVFVSYECLCCQVEVSASGRSLIQRSPTECYVSVIVKSR
jgi:hypothetical protein